jgi:phage-related protein
METLPATWYPSSATRGAMRPRILKAQFGDGYAQRARDGINTGLKTWNVIWDVIPLTTTVTEKPSLKKIYDFLAARGGFEKFLWVQLEPFDVDSAVTFVCESGPEWVYAGGKISGVSAELLEQPAL